MFFGPNLCQAKSGIISFLVVMVGGEGSGMEVWGQKIKVAQNDLKHILVLEFLRSNKNFRNFVSGHKQSINQTTTNAQSP